MAACDDCSLGILALAKCESAFVFRHGLLNVVPQEPVVTMEYDTEPVLNVTA